MLSRGVGGRKEKILLVEITQKLWGLKEGNRRGGGGDRKTIPSGEGFKRGKKKKHKGGTLVGDAQRTYTIRKQEKNCNPENERKGNRLWDKGCYAGRKGIKIGKTEPG